MYSKWWSTRFPTGKISHVDFDVYCNNLSLSDAFKFNISITVTYITQWLYRDT